MDEYKCPSCGQSIFVCEPGGVVTIDGVVYSVQKEYCNNPKCAKYCGKTPSGTPLRYIKHELKQASSETLSEVKKLK